MAQERNTPLMIDDATKKLAPSVYEQYLQSPLTLNSFLTENRGRLVTSRMPSVLVKLTAKLKREYVAVRASLVLSILQSTVAQHVASVIREFWSSTILSHASRFTPLQLSSQEDTPGPAKFCDERSENAVYSVPTVTEDTPLSNRTTTHMTSSNPPSEKSLEISVSRSECEQKLNALRNGVLDLSDITVREWIEISYMALFDNQELHLDLNVVEAGNVVHLHTCVQGIIPPASVTSLGATN